MYKGFNILNSAALTNILNGDLDSANSTLKLIRPEAGWDIVQV